MCPLPAAARWFAPRPAEESYDLATDPHELRNLADAPEADAVKQRLRRELDAWIERSDPYGTWPEDRLREHFWPGGVRPQSPPPRFALQGGSPARVALTAGSEAAPIEYRVEDGPWRLYVEPLSVAEGRSIEARSARYGYRKSEVVRFRHPAVPNSSKRLPQSW